MLSKQVLFLVMSVCVCICPHKNLSPTGDLNLNLTFDLEACFYTFLIWALTFESLCLTTSFLVWRYICQYLLGYIRVSKLWDLGEGHNIKITAPLGHAVYGGLLIVMCAVYRDVSVSPTSKKAPPAANAQSTSMPPDTKYALLCSVVIGSVVLVCLSCSGC